MKKIQIQVSEVWDLHKYAEKTYALDQPVLTQEFDSAVDHLIRCWDNLCNLLEERGRQAAERREEVSVEGLEEGKVLGMTTTAVIAIDSARRHHMWKYLGDLPNEREHFESDVNVVGLWTLKNRFNEFLDQERRNHRSGKLLDPLPWQRESAQEKRIMGTLTRITFDPAVMGGKACILGLRVTVRTVVGLLAAGRSHDDILKAYPYLERQDIDEALAYAAWRVEEREVPLARP